MGSMVSLPISSLWQKKEYRILIAGPDYGPIETVPTVGFNVESFTHGGINLFCCDLGGRQRLRPEWTAYLTPNAIIFVVDSADITLGDGANNLAHLLNEECVREASDAPLLVFANKQDLKGAKSPVEIAEALHLRELRDRRWNIAPCSATDGVGISGGMDWLVQALKSQGKSQRE
ncbi:hypothetical protein N7497_009560 [Penicillium chrysogenum]|nr:hypothetical protein N7497_009560 [Penicillium chrysogenum]